MKLKNYFKTALCLSLICLMIRPAFAIVSVNRVIAENPKLNHHMVQLAYKAYQLARHDHRIHNHHYLTMINFNKCSTARRLTIINLDNGHAIMHLLVSHGHNSGLKCADHFSNQPNSHETSLGTYVTGYPYYGHLGYSLYLHGLEKGINNNVYKRHIVMHGAGYVSEAYVKYDHRIGRTYGCLGLNNKYVKHVIQMLKGGSVIFAYATPELHDPYLT